MEKMKSEIKKKLQLPKISFPSSFLVGAVNPANMGKFTGFVPGGKDQDAFNRTINQNLAASFMNSFKKKPKPVVRRRLPPKPTPIFNLGTIKTNQNLLDNLKNAQLNNLRGGRKKINVVRPAPPRKRRAPAPPAPKPAPRISLKKIFNRKRKSSLGSVPPRPRGGGGRRPGGFGSGRVQNRFTPGNTFTGYSRGG